MELKSKRCAPCEGGVPALTPEQVSGLLAQVDGWEARDGKIHKALRFGDFAEAMAFLNRVAACAEAEGHHPDFCLHYNNVDVMIWTHAIGGLSENDFILAAKIDDLAGA
jgi:4a-hydroxytetrahydrobiopterin dehydratase